MHPSLIFCAQGIGGDTSHLPWPGVTIPSATETFDIEGLLTLEGVLNKKPFTWLPWVNSRPFRPLSICVAYCDQHASPCL